MTARELKNRTGEALRAVGRGGRVVVTMRGQPLAVMLPYSEAPQTDARDADQVFDEIRAVFSKQPLPFSWEEHRAWQGHARLFSSTRVRSRSKRASRKIPARR